ncbi:MAG: hypothetical protein WBW84_16730 [Acidobacteriaceae bacterium]
MTTPLSALADVITERRRQIEAENWAPAHDDEHTDGQLAMAAACYAVAAAWQADGSEPRPTRETTGMPEWPWDEEWWKPKDARRNLVRAAALLLAEIERVDRASQLQNRDDHGG